jgi:catechol 2,3-dioxygenase-like lactoylglutathione lyase family enzyme
MNIKFNWLGIHVSDFEASLHFYTEALGMNATDIKSNWAYFETTGITFELFGDGMPPASDRLAWGQGQALRPSIQVSDLRGTIAELRQRDVEFTGEIEQTTFGEWIEFMGPENMRWTLAQTPVYPFSQSLHTPSERPFGEAHIGWIELKVDRIVEQRAFYRDVLGLQAEEIKNGRVVLRQRPGEPLLFLESGGQRAAPLQINQGALQPLPSHISFETDDIVETAAWLKSHKVPILTEVTRKDWGGIDLYIADIDGNPIQVVQYI